MTWTKAHSQNAIAAKARLRLLRRRASAEAVNGHCAKPRNGRARFTLQFRDNLRGDSLTLNLHPAPWPHRWLSEHGEFSTARLARAVAALLQAG